MTQKPGKPAHQPTRSPAAERIAAQVRLLMKKHKTSQAELAEALGLSPSTVKRLWSSDDLSVARLEQLAAYFNIDVYDLFELARGASTPTTVLTEEQELYLATHTDVAHYFWLLLNGLGPADIAKKKGLSAAANGRYLGALEAIGLVRRGGGSGAGGADNVMRLFAWPLRFRMNGPLQRQFTEALFETFMTHLFARTKAAMAVLAGNDEAANTATHAAMGGEVSGFSLRLMQFLLPRESYDALRKDLGDVLKSYVAESRRRLATTSVAALETVTLMLGVDRFDAVAATFGEITEAPPPARRSTGRSGR